MEDKKKDGSYINDTDNEALEKVELEEAFEMLDAMIVKLEDRKTTLEASFELYKKGMELIKHCNGKIDRVEKKMLVISQDGELNEF